MKLNEVWVSGSFDFALMPETTALIESDTAFTLGDVVKSIDVDVISKRKIK